MKKRQSPDFRSPEVGISVINYLTPISNHNILLVFCALLLDIMQRQQIKMFSDPLNCQLFQTFGESFRKKFFYWK